MANDKPWNKQIVTPAGIAEYPWLTEPDSRFGEPSYKVNLRLSGEEAETFKAQLEQYAVEALEHMKAINPKYKKLKALAIPLEQAQDDTGEDIEGVYILKTKCRAFFTTKKGELVENKPAVVDAKKVAFTKPVWGGSKIKVSIQLNPYETFGGGISARLRAVQVLELVSRTGGEFGFGEEEGFESDGDDGAGSSTPSAQAPEQDDDF